MRLLQFARRVALIPGVASVFLLGQPLLATDGTNTTSGAQTANWSSLVWTGGIPNGIGDTATFGFTADQNITLDMPVTLERIDATGSGQFNLLRSDTNTLIFDNTLDAGLASVLFTRVSNDATGRRIDANVVLNSDLIATWGRVQGGGRIHGFRGIISGRGRLSLNYAVPPLEGPDTATATNLNNTSATANHIIHIGLAGDSPNTHTGGTDLRAANNVFGTVRFLTNKVNALGSGSAAGSLFMDKAALDMSVFDQTAGGLAGGYNGAKISSTSPVDGVTTLVVNFDSPAGPHDFAGSIMDGIATGVAAAIRTVAFTKTGTGTQILSGVNSYSGTTRVEAGILRAAAGTSLSTSSRLVLAGGTLDLNGQSAVMHSIKLAADSTIDFGTAGTANTLTFVNNAAGNWTGNLTIRNFDVTADRIELQNQELHLGQVHFVDPAGWSPGTYRARITATGFAPVDAALLTNYTYDGASRLVRAAHPEGQQVVYGHDSAGNLACAYTLFAGPDADHDGMPDNWEIRFLGSMSEADAESDSDSDGRRDLLEYGMATNPTTPDRAAGFSLDSREQAGRRWLAFSFRRPREVNLTYTLQASGDLAAWQSGGEIGMALGAPVDNEDGTETLTLGCPWDLFGNGKVFVRLAIGNP